MNGMAFLGKDYLRPFLSGTDSGHQACDTGTDT
jgi:hypothetical protein